MSLHPYLFFGGNCREAMERYQEVLGGELEITAFSDAPPEAAPPGIDASQVMHAGLTLSDGVRLLASDDPTGGFSGHSGVAVSYGAQTVEEATAIFNGLAEGGQVTMPLQATFWTAAFGMLRDRFGVDWMIDTEPTEG